MKVAVFDTHNYDRAALNAANIDRHHELQFFDVRLTALTADLARGYDAVCSFVNDRLDAPALDRLKSHGVRLIALRSAGFNHVDLERAKELGLVVTRVPEYSPYAVAEHTITLIMALNRKIPRANNRVHELNFSLDGLVGFDLHGKTVGLIGTGRIGQVMARIVRGFGCQVLAYDLTPDQALMRDLGVKYVDLDTLYKESDIISLHIPLTPKTRHIIDARALSLMKPGVMIANTGRGALIDSKSLIQGLKSHRIGGACLDVYEEEEGIFFTDLSDEGIADDTLARLLTFPNVLITSHQAFLTREALKNIADTTIENITSFELGRELKNLVS